MQVVLFLNPRPLPLTHKIYVFTGSKIMRKIVAATNISTQEKFERLLPEVMKTEDFRIYPKIIAFISLKL